MRRRATSPLIPVVLVIFIALAFTVGYFVYTKAPAAISVGAEKAGNGPSVAQNSTIAKLDAPITQGFLMLEVLPIIVAAAGVILVLILLVKYAGGSPE